jgi:Large extracellular alpha-helical protein
MLKLMRRPMRSRANHCTSLQDRSAQQDRYLRRDEGILQVTDYKTPDPLGFYFRKCMLRVDTAQIVDLIIPEFSLLRSVSAFGGGGDIQRLNPFKRVTEKPVVFWSGIVDADSTKREVVYDVPDYFDGTLKIMAVAIADDAVASGERET